MRIALLAPPMGADPIHPYSALPALSAFLKAHGYEDVIQRDIGIEALDYLMSPEYLSGIEGRAAKKFEDLNSKSSLTPEERRSYRMMGGALRNAGHVIRNVEKAKNVLRTNAFYNPAKVTWSKRTLGWAYNLLSTAHYPTILASGTYVMPAFSYQNSEEIMAGARQDEDDPFVDYYRDEILPWLADYDADIVGLSITYQSQLLPALVLARLIKEAGLRCHVTMGGGFVSWLCHFPAGMRALLEFADSLIVNEGETALLQMVRAVEEGKSGADLGGVRNIILRDKGEFVRGPWQMEDINQMATPTWDGLFNGKYLAPSPIYLYQTSRGCYAKCAFCCVSMHQKENGFRRRNLEGIVTDMKRIAESTPPGEETFFFIADDTHSPAQLRYLAKRMLEEGLTDFRWMCEARLDKGFTPEVCDMLYAAGLRHIFFGMESANQRVLDKMMKGTYLKYMSEGIINTARAGIGSYVSIVIGFPTETEAEAQDTIDFIMEHERYILTVGFNPFVCPWGSYVHMRPEEFGVTLKPDPHHDIQIVYNYDVKTGIDQNRALEIAMRAQKEWQLSRTRPSDLSRSLFDGYTLLYLSRYGSGFAEDLFSNLDASKDLGRAKSESLQYVPATVWHDMAEIG